ncbi:hypothetical protein [Kutzneria sp. NPDC052558]|uniref:hypothetical protein n=1 Tax=Kutzneria sp. NPDC052558 TaxID=3364121 RepID=UPI0037C95ABD
MGEVIDRDDAAAEWLLSAGLAVAVPELVDDAGQAGYADGESDQAATETTPTGETAAPPAESKTGPAPSSRRR